MMFIEVLPPINNPSYYTEYGKPSPPTFINTPEFMLFDKIPAPLPIIPLTIIPPAPTIRCPRVQNKHLNLTKNHYVIVSYNCFLGENEWA